MRYITILVFSFAIVGATHANAYAQASPWGDLKISVARVDFDLSGTGDTAGLAVRTTRDLFGNLKLEVGGLFAQPDQQFGPSTLFVPEAQLQYHWAAGRWFPYAGGGIGTAMVKSDFDTIWEPTLSVAAGTTVRLTERIGVTGEFRLRGHEFDFTGTTAEFSTGIAWRFGAF
jgi:opacity protein-like surface antigen